MAQFSGRREGAFTYENVQAFHALAPQVGSHVRADTVTAIAACSTAAACAELAEGQRCVCACGRVCVHACVCVCVRARECVRVWARVRIR